MVEEIGARGVVVLHASGADSGQCVGHLHLHVVLTWPHDGTVHWPAQSSAHRDAGDAHSALAAAFDTSDG